jgi:hypothetical protein
MATAHTPGPWHASSERWRITGGGHRFVATLDNQRTLPLATLQGNLCLIAAAPDMLAALIRVEADLTALGAVGEPLKSVRAAIAKAEGRD